MTASVTPDLISIAVEGLIAGGGLNVLYSRLSVGIGELSGDTRTKGCSCNPRLQGKPG